MVKAGANAPAFFYAQEVWYFARSMDAGSDYAQEVWYFARGMDAGSDYAQEVRYFARGMDAGSKDARELLVMSFKKKTQINANNANGRNL